MAPGGPSLAFRTAGIAALALSVIFVQMGLPRLGDYVLCVTVAQGPAFVACVVVLEVSARAHEPLRRPTTRAYTAVALAGMIVAVGLCSRYVALDIGSVPRSPQSSTRIRRSVGLSSLAASQLLQSSRVRAAIPAVLAGAIALQLVCEPL